MNSDRLKDKVAVITGSGGRIGRAACQWLARSGGTMVSVEPCDLTAPEDASRAMARAVEEFGKLESSITTELWRMSSGSVK
jgi:NAD(P)-dependent dehydrogenase (short-subunit alcohol dehydrogenase family)